MTRRGKIGPRTHTLLARYDAASITERGRIVGSRRILTRVDCTDCGKSWLMRREPIMSEPDQTGLLDQLRGRQPLKHLVEVLLDFCDGGVPRLEREAAYHAEQHALRLKLIAERLEEGRDARIAEAEDWLVSKGWTMRIDDGAWVRGRWQMSADVADLAGDLGLGALKNAVAAIERNECPRCEPHLRHAGSDCPICLCAERCS